MYQNQVKLALLALVFSLSQILAQDDFSDESATQTNNSFQLLVLSLMLVMVNP